MATSETVNPLYTITDDNERPYVSVIDEQLTIRIQLHHYDDVHPTFLVLDKRALPELIHILSMIK